MLLHIIAFDCFWQKRMVRSDLGRFVDDITDNIFEKISVYRTIILTKDHNDSIELKNILEANDFGVLMLKNRVEKIDYNNIDVRVVIMQTNLFKDFIKYIDNDVGILNSSYNLICLNYNIPECETIDMLRYYYSITCNNVCNTVFYTKYDTFAKTLTIS